MPYTDHNRTYSGAEIAVIGMAGKFPGAENLKQFWQNLQGGVESISFLSDEELDQLPVSDEIKKSPAYVRSKGGVFQGREYFDASFFGYTVQEAEMMSPQTRILHECVWHALEDAGYGDPSDQVIGLFAGSAHDYFYEMLGLSNEEGIDRFAASLLIDRDYLATRISYKLGLKGSSQLIQTACSTSLVAVDQACRALLTGICDMALAGAVSVQSNPSYGYIYQEGMIMSKDGHCRAFDKDATGSVGGEGVGMVVLKRLEDAMRDNDHILCVMKGFAVNNDGKEKVGYTAPGVNGQATVIRSAQELANIASDAITYVETHGTGTALGDVTEIEALKTAFATHRKGYCAIGSVKTNIGHLGEAAGIAGMIKTVLAIQHRQLPPSLNFKTPNPKIGFSESPFYVNTVLQDWKSESCLVAGVSSFGIGGTNAHLILEEAPAYEQPEDREHHLIILSARSSAALEHMLKDLHSHLAEHPGESLSDVCYTLQLGRKEFPYRCKLSCSTTADALRILENTQNAKIQRHKLLPEKASVVFVFAGLGSQYANMCADLYRKEQVFKNELDHGVAVLKRVAGIDLMPVLFPVDADADHRDLLHDIEFAQYLVFLIEYCLSALLKSWGIRPDACIGYSLGEYTAACICGVFDFESAVKILVKRGKLVKQLERGAMLSIPLGKSEVLPLLDAQVSLAIDNGPSCIVSGPEESIRQLESRLKERHLLSFRLSSTRALHSRMMQPVVKEMELFIKEHLVLHAPEIPYISGLTGTWVTDAETKNASYWSRHLEETIQFAGGIRTLLDNGKNIFVEIGPGSDLTTLINRELEMREISEKAMNLMRPEKVQVDDNKYILNKLGQLWLYGVSVNWSQYYQAGERRRVSLPGYPFERKRYWKLMDNYASGAALPGAPVAGRPKDSQDWFYLPTWKRSAPASTADVIVPQGERMLMFLGEDPLSGALAEELSGKTHELILVKPGKAFSKHDPRSYSMNTASVEECELLFAELKQANLLPSRIICLFGMTGHLAEPALAEDSLGCSHAYYSLLSLAKAIGRLSINKQISIDVVSDRLCDVTGEEPFIPEKSLLLGPVKVIPQEFPDLRCRCIDIEFQDKEEERTLVWRLLNQLLMPVDESTILALRGAYFWEPDYQHIKLSSAASPAGAALKDGGVYLITGGLGGIGLGLADRISREVKATLILAGRSFFPEAASWHSYLAKDGGDTELGKKIRLLQLIESRGSEVAILQMDVSEAGSVKAHLHTIEERFGKLTGIIHAAVLPDGAVIMGRDRPHSDNLFKAKVYGTRILYEAFKSHNPEFFVSFSSLNAIYGGFGQVAYCAANLFQDAFARYHSGAGKPRMVSINWDRWRNTGIAGIVERTHAELTGEDLGGGMMPDEGFACFKKILATDRQVTNIAVCVGNLRDDMERFKKPAELIGDNIQELPVSQKVSRPDLSSEYVRPSGKTEMQMAALWEDFFGIDQIGADDNFFELGGDSLKAIIMLNKYKKRFGEPMSILSFFNHPTISASAAYFDSHTNQRNTPAIAGIQPLEKKPFYILSSAQKRLFALYHFDPRSTGYNISFSFDLRHKTGKAHVQSIFEKLVARHEPLRTSFEMRQGEPVQIVHEQVDLDIAAFTIENESDYVAIKNRFIQPFDLSKAPLMRVAYLEYNDHVSLIIDMHHLVGDGISCEIIKQDVYAFQEGRSLPALPVQYKDYAAFVNSDAYLSGISSQKAYWHKVFETEAAALQLPGDFARPAFKDFSGAVYTMTLNAQEYACILAIANENKVTSYMALLALTKVFLYKLSGQHDIVVGTSVGGRREEELEPLVGMFVNTLALRSHLSADTTFVEFVGQIKETTLQAFENQDYPFEHLVEHLAYERDMSRNPLFDVMFAFQGRAQDFGDVLKQNLPFLNAHYTASSKFDLTFNVIEGDGTMLFNIEYSTSLFRAETIERYVGYLRRIMAVVSETQDVKLGDIDFLSKAEEELVTREFNQTQADFPMNRTIVDFFDDQVKRRPEAPAVTFNGKTLTYQQLGSFSDQLAQTLIDVGATSNQVIGVQFERSLEMMVGIFAVLKAGAAYMPIDPAYPADRKQYMLENSGANMLLTQEHASLEGVEGLEVIRVSLDALSDHSAIPPLNRSEPEGLAYVIYTSGSTGRPKGVMIEHRSLMNRLHWMQHAYKLNTQDVILQKTPYTFDVSVWELLLWAMSGARMILLEPGGEKDPESITAAIQREQVSLIHFVPSMFKIFLDQLRLSGKTDVLRSLKHIVCSGEALGSEEVKSCYELLGINATMLSNLYGPTEASIDVSYYACRQGDDLQTVPIGKPIDNCELFILDENLKPRGIGLPGELYIAGVGLARGYLNNRELTEEKFVDHLWKPHQRMYRTGDLAKWRVDGNIEYLGRIDDQVKIRGYRIELGEIERQLLTYRGIKDAKVIATPVNGDKALCAYFVSADAVDIADVRRYLLGKLPDYMIPAFFTQVGQIPLTANGKVDKKALPKPEVVSLSEYLAPATPVEMKMAAIWGEVLMIDGGKIGAHANFFELGGHSLRATLLISRIRDEFQVSVRLVDIFKMSSLKNLAMFIESLQWQLSDEAVGENTKEIEL